MIQTTSKRALFALPGGKQKAIDNARLPHIAVAGSRKLTSVACVNTDLVRQVIVEPEVGALGVHRWQAVARVRTIAKGLLHAEDRFKPAQRAFGSAELRESIVSFDPVPLRMLSVRVLRAQPEGAVDRFPPHVKAGVVL